MLLSHYHKIIFIKTRKTAGTSIEISVSRFCSGPEDIITRISPEDEVTRWRHRVKPKGYMDGQGREIFYNHMPAMEVRQQLPELPWDDYFSFAFERNPWDKCVSMYYWELQNKPGVGFAEWIMDPEADLPINWYLYTTDGKLSVKAVYKWEDLPRVLMLAQARGGIPDEGTEIQAQWFDGWLPNAKSRFRPPNTPYQSLYNDETRERVAEAFAEEIKFWGYEFG